MMTFIAYLVHLLSGAGILVVALPIAVSAYELNTHEALAREAFAVSGLGTTLRTFYGIFPSDDFRGRLPLFIWEHNTPEGWIAKGGRDEDSPWSRVLNHFFDPYHDEPLTFPGATRAPDWALEDQADFVSPPQNYSYKDARDALYRGLVARDSATHERELGHTFYALGHVIHLIQDMAQPQHTRNDSHFFIGPTASLMESYVNENIDRFTLTGALLPAVTRARDLWVKGMREDMTGFGMSEFSNVNFVSAGTNFTELRTGATADVFPRPVLNIGDFSLVSSADACRDGALAPGDLLFYANAITDPVGQAGQRNERMTTYSIFDQSLISRGRRPIFALNCFNLDAAASILLPRAASYSAALLKYFFRGRIEIAPPDRFVYGLAAYQPGNTGAFTRLRFRVRNATPNEDAGRGQLTAVVRYRTSAENLIENPLADISPPRFAVSQAIDLDGLSPTFNEFVFDFSQSPIPTNAADLFLTVVYRGSLGLEEDAVLVGGKDLYEPDPLDRENGTDYECFNAQIFRVMGLPPYRYPDHVERDVNNDGTVDLHGPYVERTLLIKTFDLTGPAPAPSLENFDFKVPQLDGGQYVRFLLLQDQEFYGVVLQDAQIEDLSTGASRPHSVAFQLDGILNGVFQGPAGEIVRRVHLPAVDRGLLFLHKIRFDHLDPTPCLPQLRSVPENLTRVDGTLPTE